MTEYCTLWPFYAAAQSVNCSVVSIAGKDSRTSDRTIKVPDTNGMKLSYRP